MIGNPNAVCTQNKYSMLEHNQRNAQGDPWVTALIYQSTADPEGFYMAFEDFGDVARTTGTRPASTAITATNDPATSTTSCFYVSGISCEGGGQPMRARACKSACSVSRTDCATDSTTPACVRPIIAPGVEACDNVDNDCNGIVDDGDGGCAPVRKFATRARASTRVEPENSAAIRA